MAGILGYIRVNDSAPELAEETFSKMLSALVNESSQKVNAFKIKLSWLGIAGNINSALPPRILNNENGIFAVCEGNISIIPEALIKIRQTYPSVESQTSDYKLIPYLYELYGSDIANALSGNFNIACIDINRNKAILFNSKFGMLTLFYYLSNNFLLFSSKLLPIVKSGLLEIKWDKITQLEQIVFNFPLSDHTLIERVDTLEAGHFIEVNGDNVHSSKHWSIESLFGRPTISKKESIELIYQSFWRAIDKGLSTTGSPIWLSLTGGWDGRLVLSYLIKNNILEDLNLYSFGAAGSTDISIPQKISAKLSIPYLKVVLDDYYIENFFWDNATETILLSNGHRPFLRTHYLYAMKQLSRKASFVLSGNCGSNILKFGLIKPGTVVNRNLLHIIEVDDKQRYAEMLFDRYSKIIPGIEPSMKTDFMHRLGPVLTIFRNSETLSEGYYQLLLSVVERKFFGVEQNSYNDYVYNLSPFIDESFISDLSTTVFWGAKYPFNSKSLRLRKLSTDLYSEIIKRNSSFLWNFPTDRDISFKDLTTLRGKIKILKRKFVSKPVQPGKFNTQSLEDVFKGYFHFNIRGELNKEESANLISTTFFKKQILE